MITQTLEIISKREVELPAMMINAEGYVVLFSKPTTGMVLKSDNVCFSVGEYRTDWENYKTEKWRAIEGELKLKNVFVNKE
jgi:hypothetical protein